MNTLFTFFSVHQNIMALAILFLIVGIWLITKKNYKMFIPVILIFFGLCIGCYQLTEGKTWTREFYSTDELPKTMIIYEQFNDSIPLIEHKDTLKVTFGIGDKTPWVVQKLDQNANKQLLHWCWVDDYWEKFGQTDLVAWIWGENAGKKVRGSSESRLNNLGE